MYCEIHPWDVTDDEVRAFKPRGVILSGGPESVTDAQPPQAPEVGVHARRARARHLLRHADDGAAARRPRRVLRPSASSATPKSRVDRRVSRCSTTSRIGATAQGRAVLDVWMSHGDRVEQLPAGLRRHRCDGHDPVRRDERREARASTACSSIPKSRTRSRARSCCERFVREICGCDALLERREHHRGRDRARARAGGHGQGAAGPFRRRRLVGRRGAAASTRSAISSSACSSTRPAAPGRRRPGDARRSPSTSACASSAWMPRARFLARARGRRGPGSQAQDHRPDLHRGVR